MGDDIDFTTESYEGSCIERDGVRYISDMRKSEDGQVSALLTLDKDFMVITQKGSLNSSLKFVPKETTENSYGTPQGIVHLSIFTNKYSVYHLKNGIKIELSYDLLTGSAPIKTQMSIVVNFL